MNFISSYNPPENCREPAWWYIFHNEKLLVHADGQSARLSRVPDPESLNIPAVSRQYLGTLEGIHCYAADAGDLQDGVPQGMSFCSLRELFALLSEDIFRVAMRASVTMYWDRTHRFCGKCGAPTRLSDADRARVCAACGFTSYPRISPAVIVAVVRDGKILLGHSKRFPQSFYSVLAGFVEPGETLEECVQREIKEETGIEVADIRYFHSQPWPFPDSLMIGFTARYAGGEIDVDGEEVTEAGWFAPDDLPEIPGKISIARRLIDWFVEEYKGAPKK